MHRESASTRHDSKPPWSSRDERERLQMKNWVHGKIDLELDRLLEKSENTNRNTDHNAWIKFMGTEEYSRMIREDARRLARQGNIEPLSRTPERQRSSAA